MCTVTVTMTLAFTSVFLKVPVTTQVMIFVMIFILENFKIRLANYGLLIIKLSRSSTFNLKKRAYEPN